MTGYQYLLSRLGELERTVAALLDQKALVEKERDALLAKRRPPKATKAATVFAQANTE